MSPSFPPLTSPASLPSSNIELSLRCENLLNTDVLSKSDPFCVVYTKHPANQANWMEIGRTEHISDTLFPVWQKKVAVEYRFEERQVLKFAVFDKDSNSFQVEDHDFLGSVECSLGEIVGRQSRGFSKGLEDGKGTIFVYAEEILNCKEEVTLSFSGRKLDKMDFFGKSDPYLEIHKSTESNQYILVHRTEVIKRTLNPDWKPIQIPASALCNGDMERDLKFEVYDWNSSGSPDLIGEFHSNLNKLKEGRGTTNTYSVINKAKKAKKGDKYKNSGTIVLNSVQSHLQPSFLDFIRSGTQVNFTVAVDFTASNGNPDHPESLHYRSPTGKPNQYITAIQSVGEIIQDYDYDKQFPALGFGARIPPTGQVSHEFYLNFDPKSPYCSGIEGVLAAYYNSLYQVQLYGPTNFTPVIRHVARFAKAYQEDPTNYFVLLIITDGVITDFEDTKEMIILASELPLSIIVVGVGNADFSAMEELDSDDKLLQAGPMVAKRDIVQFVELQKFLVGGTWSKELLAKEVLAEVPAQLLSYMKLKGFKPPEVRPEDGGGGLASFCPPSGGQTQPPPPAPPSGGFVTGLSGGLTQFPGAHTGLPPPPQRDQVPPLATLPPGAAHGFPPLPANSLGQVPGVAGVGSSGPPFVR